MAENERITTGVPDAPPPGAVERAVTETGGTEAGKVMKVIYLDESGERIGEWSSQQIPEDPFAGTRVSGLQDPPYPLEQLVYLAEVHPVHSSALEQKTVDVCGTGWDWLKEEDDEEADTDEAEKKELNDWFERLAPDEESIQEVLVSCWNDVETTGWGMFEVSRSNDGTAGRIYHVPSHTVRAHRDGLRLVQMRGSKKVWFRRWGIPDLPNGEKIMVDANTGSLKTVRNAANDLFVIRRKSRRSSWYGIPAYVSAIGYLTLALAARDDNLLFFQNRREPRWAIVLSNIADDPNLERDLRRAFTVNLKQPYRSIIIPISGPGKVDFQKLTDDKSQDGTFDKLAERADKAILIAHRIPGERLANSTVGSLGGNIAVDVNRIYKEGVVTPSQELYDTRLNRFILVEYSLFKDGGSATKNPKGAQSQAQLEPLKFKLHLIDLDVETERDELDLVVIEFHADLITLGEARKRLGRPVLMAYEYDETGVQVAGSEKPSPYNDMLFSELPGNSGQAGGAGHEPSGAGALDDAEKNRDPALALLDADVREMMESSRQLHRAVTELADRD